jgi:hypothetical protein
MATTQASKVPNLTRLSLSTPESALPRRHFWRKHPIQGLHRIPVDYIKGIKGLKSMNQIV